MREPSRRIGTAFRITSMGIHAAKRAPASVTLVGDEWIEERNWAEIWRLHAQPIRVGRRLLVLPSGHEPPSGEELTIERLIHAASVVSDIVGLEWSVRGIYEPTVRLVEALRVHPNLNASIDLDAGTVTYHDSCHLRRGLGVVDAPRTLLRAIPGVARACREGGGVSYAEFGEDMVAGIDRSNSPGMRILLTRKWLPAMPDVVKRLQDGIRVADVFSAFQSSWPANLYLPDASGHLVVESTFPGAAAA